MSEEQKKKKEKMNKQEKQSLCILIMEDIRGNWAYELSERVQAVIDLAKELEWKDVVELAEEFEYDDGRHFRCSFEFGGYENPPFKVIRKLKGTSKEFRERALSILTHPEYRFEDYKTE